MLAIGMRSYWVYILASRPRGMLYVVMTRDLVRRVYDIAKGRSKVLPTHTMSKCSSI